MMKLYRYTFGEWVNYGPANDDEDAFERRIGIDPQFHYVPVTIEEVKLDGYTIRVTADEQKTGSQDPSHIVHTLDRDGLKSWLTEHDVEFIPQWGEVKLKELALQHI